MNKKIALISVSDKTGVADFARALAGTGMRILSTGGTLVHLQEHGIPAESVSDFTGFPEIMDGRVKTLHPKIHGGLLALRELETHRAQMQENGITPIDIVAVNLYPFEATVAKPGVTLEEAIENIDIGGPSMVRSAAKNFRHVTVVTDPADYATVAAEFIRSAEVPLELRKALAVKAFSHVADYDAAIDEFLSERLAGTPVLRMAFHGGQTLRYGENPHQKARFFVEKGHQAAQESNLGNAVQLHGKELSYNNLVDGDAALEAVRELSEGFGVAIVKHTNPCGYATGSSLAEAMEAAWEGDPVSAFGSVIACTRKVDLQTAEFLKGRFVEMLIAPGFDADALDFLRKKSKDIRLLEIGSVQPALPTRTYKHIMGGMLEQDRDIELAAKWESVTRCPFPESKLELARFTWKACKHVRSNAIVMGWEYKPGKFQVLGIGPGQPNRIDSNLKLCQPRVRENARRRAEQLEKDPETFIQEVFNSCVLASDAFFPFDDNVLAAHEAGIGLILQPGGALRDREVIDTCDRLGVSMVFTGTRHFRH